MEKGLESFPAVSGKVSPTRQPLVSDPGHTAMYVNDKEQKPVPNSRLRAG